MRYLHQFLVHKAIDAVDEVKWTTDRLNLKVVDDFNEWVVSSFITAGQVKLYGTTSKFFFLFFLGWVGGGGRIEKELLAPPLSPLLFRLGTKLMKRRGIWHWFAGPTC